MQRTSLMIDGFLAYYEPTTITYSEGKITAITGPNGSGKTSIPDAVAWVRYGRVRVRGDSDSVISDFADEAHVVEELVDQNGQHWKFDRKKRRGKAQVLSVFSWNGADEEWQRYGTKRIADNQQIIDDLLGLNMNAFYSLSVFESRSGNRGIRLVSSKSEERIGILTSLRPSMAVWPELNKVVGNDLRDAKRELVSRQDVLEVLRDDHAELTDEQASLRDYVADNGPLSAIDAELKNAERRLRAVTDQESSDKIELIESQREQARMEMKSKLRDIGDDIGDVQSELGEITNAAEHVEELTEEIEEVSDQIKQITASRKKSVVAVAKFATTIEETSALVNEHSENIAVLSNAEKTLEEKRLDLEERLRAAEDSEGHCVVCGSKISDSKHAEIIDAINAEMDATEDATDKNETDLKKTEKERSKLRAALKKAKSSHAAAQDHIAATDEQIADLKSDLREAENAMKRQREILESAEASSDELKTELDKLRKRRNRLETISAEKIDALTEEIREIKNAMPNAKDVQALENSIKRISSSRDEFVSATAQITQIEGQIKQKDTKILEQRELIEESRETVADLELLKEATSQRGIPYLMLSDMLTNIEVKADEYLNLINGDHNSMTVDLEQNHESAKPTLEIMVTFADGTVRPVEALSNGEVTRVSLALMFALAHVVNSSRPGTVTDVFLDEPLAAVDDIGIDGVMSALRFAIDSGVVDTIMIVAHDRSIVDACDDEVSIDSIREGAFEDYDEDTESDEEE